MSLFDIFKRKPKLGPLVQTILVPAIGLNGHQIYRLHEMPLAAFAVLYAPFNGFTIQNTSAVPVKVVFNYNSNNYLYVTSGGVQVRKNQDFCNFDVIPQGGAINANEVIIWFEKI